MDFGIIFLVYLVVVSFIAAIMVIIDKIRAKSDKSRVGEATLFWIAILGGSVGMYLAMCMCHHKTQKNRFVFGVPLIFILQCAVIYVLQIELGIFY